MRKKKGLSRGEVKRGMRRLMGRVRSCFDKYKVPGQLVLRVTVQPSGRASAVPRGQFAGSATGRCVAAGVARIVKFPSFAGPAISFSYPFILQ